MAGFSRKRKFDGGNGATTGATAAKRRYTGRTYTNFYRRRAGGFKKGFKGRYTGWGRGGYRSKYRNGRRVSDRYGRAIRFGVPVTQPIILQSTTRKYVHKDLDKTNFEVPILRMEPFADVRFTEDEHSFKMVGDLSDYEQYKITGIKCEVRNLRKKSIITYGTKTGNQAFESLNIETKVDNYVDCDLDL